MKIWIVNPFEEFPVSGTRPLRYGTLCRILASRGHEVTWWSSSFSHLTKRKREMPIADSAFTYRLIGAPPYKHHIGLARLINHRAFSRGFYQEALKAELSAALPRPDLIVASLPPLGVIEEAFRLRALWGCRVVVDIVDAWPETFLRLVPGSGKASRAAGRLLLRPLISKAVRAYRGADGISLVAQTFAQLPEQAGSTAPVHLTYVGSDLVGNAPPQRRWPSEVPLRFVYIGAMGHSYDLETVLGAAQRLKEACCSFEVHLAGKGPKEQRLRKMAEASGLGHHVFFHGYLGGEALQGMLEDSHVALNPIFNNAWIAFPYKMSEYLGAGLAVINSLTGETRDLLESSDAGCFYRAGDPEALAEQMKRYCETPGLAKRQGANGWNLAARLLDRASSYPQLAKFLENIAEKTRGEYTQPHQHQNW